MMVVSPDKAGPPADDIELDVWPQKYTPGGQRTVKLVAVLLVMAILAVSYLRLESFLGRNDSEEERPGNLFLEVTGNTVLSGRQMTVQGDILVKKNAHLSLVDCNITMNGTIRVFGGLSICGTTMRDFPARLGYYVHHSLTILSNLTGCRWAWLNFTVEYPPRLARILRAGASSDALSMDDLWIAGTSGKENVTLDLSPFCGGVVRVELDPELTTTHYDIIEPSIATDLFCTTVQDMMVQQTDGHYIFETPHLVYYPFQILSDDGEIRIQDSTLSISGGIDSFMKTKDSTISITGCNIATGRGGNEALDCHHDRLVVRNSTFQNGNMIICDDSTVEVSDTLFENGYSAILAHNTDVSVDHCCVQRCNEGIRASADTPGNRGKLRIHGTDINLTGQHDSVGVAIKNLSASIHDSDILAHVPVLILPPDGLGRGNASMASFADILNNFIQVETTYMPSCPGITILSSIPISGVDSLVRGNRWNASMPVARYLQINETSQNHNVYVYPSEISYNDTGLAAEYDVGMQPMGEHRFDDGWVSLPYRMRNPWWVYETTTGIIPMESFAATSTGYCWSRLDVDAVAICRQTDAGTGTVEIDPGAAQRPSEIFQVDLSAIDVPFEPGPLDVQLYGLRVGYDQNTHAPVISLGIDSTSPKPENVNITLSINDRTLDSGESSLWSGVQEIYGLDMAGMASGELSINVTVPGKEETNLSNNRIDIPLTIIDSSRLIEHASDISGIWCLRNGSNIAIRDCNTSTSGLGVYFFGEGGNRVEISGSTLNFTRLGLYNCSGRINDTELVGSPPIYSSVSSVTIGTGSWELENVTTGCHASEFDMIAREYRDDPGDAVERYCTGSLGWNSTWTYLDVTVENLTCKNLSQAGGECHLRTNSTLTMTGSQFIMGSVAIACQGNATLLGNSFWLTWDISLAAGLITARNNTFSDVIDSFYVEYTDSNCVFNGNLFVANPFEGHFLNTTGIKLAGEGPPLLNGNTFINISAAVQVLWRGPVDAAGLMSSNRFVNSRSAIAFSQKSLTFQLNYMQLCLMANMRLDQVQLFWNDTMSPGSHQYDTTYISSGDRLQQKVSFYDWNMDAAGSESRLGQFKVHLVATGVSGTEWSRDLEFTIPEFESWTVTIG